MVASIPSSKPSVRAHHFFLAASATASTLLLAGSFSAETDSPPYCEYNMTPASVTATPPTHIMSLLGSSPWGAPPSAAAVAPRAPRGGARATRSSARRSIFLARRSWADRRCGLARTRPKYTQRGAPSTREGLPMSSLPSASPARALLRVARPRLARPQRAPKRRKKEALSFSAVLACSERGSTSALLGDPAA